MNAEEKRQKIGELKLELGTDKIRKDYIDYFRERDSITRKRRSGTLTHKQ